MKFPEPKTVYVPEFYEDGVTGIKKRSCIIRCTDCTIFQKRGGSGCKSLGYCQFSKYYEEIDKSYDKAQRVRIIKIMMSGYNNPRG